MIGLRIVITTAIGEPHQTVRPGFRKIAVSMLLVVVRGSTIRDHYVRLTSSGSRPPPGFEILVFGLGGLLADDFCCVRQSISTAGSHRRGTITSSTPNP
jgi:hypothetical protein